MAKITGGLLSLGSRGTIGGAITFASWKGQPYARQTVIPANPQTTEQTTTRNAFKTANDFWKTAPALFVAPWDRFAQGQTLTGRNAFVGKYVSDLRGLAVLTTMQFSPGAKGGLAPTALVLTPAALQITADITTPAAPPGWTLQAAVAAIIRQGDPQTTLFTTMQASEDLAAPYSIVFAGLEAATAYVVGAWTRWLKPDGSLAYGASLQDTATTP